MKKYDVVILTARKYLNAEKGDFYSENIILEDRLVTEALTARGLNTIRLSWDDSSFDWNQTRAALFRTTWDYFERFDEFSAWFDKTAHRTAFINPQETVYRNRDKHYLLHLSKKGVRIPPTVFIDKGAKKSLQDFVSQTGWKEIILKPTVSGAGMDTYRFAREDAGKYESVFRELTEKKDLMIQEFQDTILQQGEISLVFFGNDYSHAVLKKGKEGDFRVQDDFGGTVRPYTPTAREVEFGARALAAWPLPHLYARVDIMRDNKNRLCLGELELIEPELWFRLYPDSAGKLAEKVAEFLKRNGL